MSRQRFWGTATVICGLLITGLGLGNVSAAGTGPYDIAIVGGRVMDPATGLDAIRNVGIRDGSIRATYSEPVSNGRDRTKSQKLAQEAL